ncbi:Vegetative incompatibility protein HET-E-1 [Psilocybe cubensis]|uniref:NACHT domain-containing protein n=2 Tax=Psilocybe cubensis TaxID=181762 RepID=A0A8H7Y8J9_PSICU|nr:Vegetative incompatibility protein HET-E-1 [Psilocybe cubensis]KAH9485862.1 Vegetative incompatibility protein HET-E-1 [Psilocybe cubensis]
MEKRQKPARKGTLQSGTKSKNLKKAEGKVERRRDIFLKPFSLIFRPSGSESDVATSGGVHAGLIAQVISIAVLLNSQLKELNDQAAWAAQDIASKVGKGYGGNLTEEFENVEINSVIPKSIEFHDAVSEPIPTDFSNAVQEAQISVLAMQSHSSMPQESFKTTFELVLRKLDSFSSIVEDLAEIHPFAKMAYKILFFASNAIVEQMDLDNDIRDLVGLVNKTYIFVDQAHQVQDMLPQLEILKALTLKTVEVAHFIVDYSKKKNFWVRTCQNLVSSAKERITAFTTEFDELMNDFRTHSALHTQVNTYHLLGKLDRLSSDFDLNSVEYAKGATGYSSVKQCLATTRVEILDEITNWVNDTSSESNVMWVSGGAGTGKSTIAHTIARRFAELGSLGSCFSFDKNAAGDRRHEKIFSTIARDLADIDPAVKSALSQVLHDAPASVKSTTDLFQQWETFILGTFKTIYDREESSASIIGPVLIVIDALDESGDDIKTRSALLSILGGEKGFIQNLPRNFRIVITSRPSVDIYNVLKDRSHVVIKSMDDIPLSKALADISAYISSRLLPQLEDFLDADHLQILVGHSDGLFQWAYLACEYMLGNSFGGLTVEEKFDDLCSNSAEVTGDVLLQDTYYLILSKLFDIKRPTVLARFQSVMGQILATMEPLPQASLNTIRSRFIGVSKTNSDISVIVNHMGSLLVGVTNKTVPIRPVHTSFYDFLKDKDASKEFYVDTSIAQSTLAHSCLDIMIDKTGLKFNVLNISSSFTQNQDIPSSALETIPAHLVYACKFWANHLEKTEPDDHLLSAIHSLLFEKFLFWLEVIALTKSMNKCVEALSILTLWIPDPTSETKLFAEDAQKFIRVFGGVLDESVPHLYLSAIPFAPRQSVIYRTYNQFFHHTLKVAEGHLNNWPTLQLTITSHYDAVNSAAFSPDGTLIASGSDDESVIVYDAVTAEEIYTFEEHAESVLCLAFSPKGELLASCSDDGNVILWNPRTGAVAHRWEHDGDSAQHVAFSADGTKLAVVLEKLSVCVYAVSSGKRLKTFGKKLDDPSLCAAFSPDNLCIASSTESGKIYIWDVKSGNELQILGADDEDPWTVSSIAFSPVDSNILATVLHDDSVCIWDIAKSAKIHVLEGHTDSVTSVAFSSDGTKVVSGSADTDIIIWNAITGEEINTLEGHSDWVQSVYFSPDDSQVVSASIDNTVCVWDAVAGHSTEYVLEGHSAWIAAVCLSSNGDFIVSASHDCTIGIWDSNTGTLIKYLEDGHEDPIKWVTVSSDNLWVASASDDEMAIIWDIESGKVIKTFKGHTDSISCVAFKYDNSKIITACDDYLVHIWDVETTKIDLVFNKHTDVVFAAQFSPDGEIAASCGSDKLTYVWNSSTGEILHTLKEHEDDIYNLAFSPNGEHLVTGSHDCLLCIWDIKSGQLLKKLEQVDTALSVAYSHDGTKIVSGSDDHMVYVWDVESGQVVTQLEGHSGSVQAAVFSNDGSKIVSCGADRMIRVWVLEKQPGDDHNIQFSNVPEHALKITEDFLNFTPLNEDDDKPVTKVWDQACGWAVGPKGQKLFWVPPQFHGGLITPSTSLLIGPQRTTLDLSDLVYGSEWPKCFLQN